MKGSQIGVEDSSLIAVAVLVATLCNVGCIVPYPVKETRDARPSATEVGKTRSHVFETSGLPDAATPDGRFYLYRFTRKSGVGLFGLTPYGADSSEATRFWRGRLLIEFDAEGHIKEMRIHKCDDTKPDPICGWDAASVQAEGEMWLIIEQQLGSNSTAVYRSSLSPLLVSATRFREALDSGDAIDAAEWLDRGVDANTMDQNSRLPISKAAGGGHVALLRLLIERGAAVNVHMPNGETPLHEAVQAGHVETARLLIDNGADVNARGKSNSTPLHLAASAGNGELVELLSEHGASRKAKDEYGHRPAVETPLHEAARAGDIDAVRILIDNGADINAPGREGQRPLHEAVQAGDVEIARLLIDNGADIDARGKWNSTPLHMAAFVGNGELVELLLEHGASIKAKDRYGRRPADVAVFTNHDEILPLFKR